MIGNIVSLLVLVAFVVLFGWLAKRAWGAKRWFVKFPGVILGGFARARDSASRVRRRERRGNGIFPGIGTGDESQSRRDAGANRARQVSSRTSVAPVVMATRANFRSPAVSISPAIFLCRLARWCPPILRRAAC